MLEPTTEGTGSSFTFTPLEKAFPSLNTSDAKDSLRKWNLEPFMVAKAFRFDQPFSPEQADAFLMDLLGSAVVQEVAPVCTGPGGAGVLGSPASWSALGTLSPGALKYRRLATTVLRLDFFDRLREAEIVRAGEISKCLDSQCGEILVSDRLRKLLLDEVRSRLKRRAHAHAHAHAHALMVDRTPLGLTFAPTPCRRARSGRSSAKQSAMSSSSM